MLGCDLLLERSVLGRIRAVYRRADYCDNDSACRDRRCQRLGVNALRQAGHHDDTLLGEFPAKASSLSTPFTGCFASPHYGHARPLQQRCVARVPHNAFGGGLPIRLKEIPLSGWQNPLAGQEVGQRRLANSTWVWCGVLLTALSDRRFRLLASTHRLRPHPMSRVYLQSDPRPSGSPCVSCAT